MTVRLVVTSEQVCSTPGGWVIDREALVAFVLACGTPNGDLFTGNLSTFVLTLSAPIVCQSSGSLYYFRAVRSDRLLKRARICQERETP